MTVGRSKIYGLDKSPVPTTRIGRPGEQLAGPITKTIRAESPFCDFGARLCGTWDMAFTDGVLGKEKTVGASTKKALGDALAILGENGFRKGDVVKARVFLDDMRNFGEFNKGYGEIFGNHKPARECVKVAGLPGNGLVQVSLIVSKEPMTKIFSEEAPAAIGPYSQAIMAGNRLYLSGQIAEGKHQEIKVLAQLAAVLGGAGMTMADVVKASVYMKDLGAFPAVNEAFKQFFQENPPAREAVQMAALPKNVDVEISLIAENGAGKEKKVILPRDTPAPVGHYSPAVEIDGTVFVSGHICKSGSPKYQTATVLENLGKTLRAAGAEPQDVVAATVFLSDLGYRQGVGVLLNEFFAERMPVVEFVNPTKLPFGVDVEISCVAVK